MPTFVRAEILCLCQAQLRCQLRLPQVPEALLALGLAGLVGVCGLLADGYHYS